MLNSECVEMLTNSKPRKGPGGSVPFSVYIFTLIHSITELLSFQKRYNKEESFLWRRALVHSSDSLAEQCRDGVCS